MGKAGAARLSSSEDTMGDMKGKKKKYYDSLIALRAEIKNQMDFLSGEALSALKDGGGDLSSMSTHMADRGSDAFLRSMELDMLSNEGDILELVEEAIQRLVNDDDFGVCRDCGEKIQEARLKIIPYAKYCVECKAIRERNNGLNPNLDK